MTSLDVYFCYSILHAAADAGTSALSEKSCRTSTTRPGLGSFSNTHETDLESLSISECTVYLTPGPGAMNALPAKINSEIQFCTFIKGFKSSFIKCSFSKLCDSSDAVTSSSL